MFLPGIETREDRKNAGRAKLQFHSTSMVIGIVSQYLRHVPTGY